MTENNIDITTGDIDSVLSHLDQLDQAPRQAEKIQLAAQAISILNQKADATRRMAEGLLASLSHGGLLHRDTDDRIKKLDTLVNALGEAFGELDKNVRSAPTEGSGKERRELLKAIEQLIHDIDREKRALLQMFVEETRTATVLTTATGQFLVKMRRILEFVEKQRDAPTTGKEQRAQFQGFIDRWQFMIQEESSLMAMLQMTESHVRDRLNAYAIDHLIPHLADLERIGAAVRMAAVEGKATAIEELRVVASKERAAIQGTMADDAKLRQAVKDSTLDVLNTIRGIGDQEDRFKEFLRFLEQIGTSVRVADKWTTKA